MKGRQLLDAMEYIDDALIEEAAPLFDASAEGQKRKKRRLHANIIVAAAALAVTVSLWIWKGEILVQQTEENAAQDYEMARAFTAAEVLEPESAEVTAEQKASDIADDTIKTDKLSGTEYSMLSDAADNSSLKVIEEFPPRTSSDDVQKQAVSEQSAVCYKEPEKGEYFLYTGLQSAIDCYDNAMNTIEQAEPESYIYHVTIDVFGERTEEGCTVYEELRFSEEGREKLCVEYNRLLAIGMTVSLSEDYELTGLLSSEEIEGFEPCADYGYAFRLINEIGE